MKNKLLILGFFDAVHKGHEYLIKESIKFAKENNLVPYIFTFSKNPYLYFNQERKEIFNLEERKRRIKNLGINNFYIVEPTNDFFSIKYKDFIKILVFRKKFKDFACGADYSFGYNREGNAEKFKAVINEMNNEKSLNLKLKVFNLVAEDFSMIETSVESKNKISSTSIVEGIKKGKIELVNKYLSENYTISGTVIRGKSKGKSVLNYPTANLDYQKDILTLGKGVYIGYVYVNDKKYKGIINVGAKPTFNDKSENIETHILDFNKNIYAKDIRIEFIKKIRETRKFDSTEQLKEQLSKDEKVARSEL